MFNDVTIPFSTSYIVHYCLHLNMNIFYFSLCLKWEVINFGQYIFKTKFALSPKKPLKHLRTQLGRFSNFWKFSRLNNQINSCWQFFLKNKTFQYLKIEFLHKRIQMLHLLFSHEEKKLYYCYNLILWLFLETIKPFFSFLL